MKDEEAVVTNVEFAEEYTRNLLAELHSLVPIVVQPTHQYYLEATAVFIEACNEFLNSELIKSTMCPLLYEVYVTAINRCLASFKKSGESPIKPEREKK